MQSHRDSDAALPVMPREKFERLKKQAKQVMAGGGSKITFGAPGERAIKEWETSGVHCRKLPSDPSGMLRLSIGGGYRDTEYCVYRGNIEACIDLLERALKALRAGGGTKPNDP